MDYVQEFKEGVVQDFYDQPEGTLYDLQNFHLINVGGSSFAITSPKGNIPISDLTEGYTPLALSGSQNRIVVHSAWIGNNLRNNGEVGILEINKQNLTATYTPLYNHVGLNFQEAHAIEGLLFPENNNTEGSYWTDFNSPPRTLNILNSKLYNLYTNTSGLTIGKSYMVSQGQILHNGVLYGPAEAAGTVFVAANINFVNPSGNTFRLIDYIPLELLDWTPVFKAGQIRLKKPIAGAIPCGVYTFVYQLLDEDGAVTNWSMPTFPIRVAGPSAITSAITSYPNHQGHPFGTLSSQGIQLEVTNLDMKYTRIRVAMVAGTALGVYEEPVVIYDSSFDEFTVLDGDNIDDGKVLKIDFIGSEYLTQLTEEDISQVLLRIEKVKTIATVNNILFPGNIVYSKDFVWDPSVGVSARCVKQDLIHDVQAYGSLNFLGHFASTNPLPLNGRIMWQQKYKVVGPVGSYITYPSGGTQYFPGDVFTGLQLTFNPGAETAVSTNGATIQAIIRIKKYDDPINGPVYNDVVIDKDFSDNAGMTANNYAKSLWRDETYRYAIGLHDLAGNITYARWIADKRIPQRFKRPTDVDFDGNVIGFDMDIVHIDGGHFSNPRVTVRSVGLVFDGIDFNSLAASLGIALADIPNYFSGFSILRCELDATIIAQGTCFPLMKTNLAGNPLIPMAYGQPSFSSDYYNHPIVANIEMFYSPDFQLRYNGLPSFQDASGYEIVMNYFPSGGGLMANVIGYPIWQYKYVSAEPNPIGTIHEYGINRYLDVANSVPEVDMGGTATVNGFPFINTPIADDVQSPIGGLTGNNGDAVGARGGIIVSDMNPSKLGIYDKTRPVINIKRNKPVLYGGSSTSAKANNQYISTGHFQAFSSRFMTALSNSAGVLNGVEVYGGDATIGFHCFTKDMNYDGNANSYRFLVGVPLEAKTNFFLREGRTTAKNAGLSNVNSEQWLYNTAYSNSHLTVPYDAVPEKYKPVNEFPYRGLYSFRKTPGEITNSFRRFATGNFRDVSGLNGPICNFKGKAMRLFYWQEDALGYIPVNERAALTTSIGEAVTMGEGGVMQRYDERTRFYGNQHQFGIAETPQGFVWPDIKRKTLCYMSLGQEVTEIASVKGMNSFLQKRINGNIISGDSPFLRVGVISGYDYKTKKTYITVRGTDTGDFTMAFDHLKPQFAGFYPFLPTLYHTWGEDLITNSENLTLGVLSPGQYNAGDLVHGLLDDDTWICIQSYVHSGSQNPSLLPFFWQRISKKNQLWMQNLGDIAKFFGRVHPSSLKFISLTSDQKVEKVFDNFIFHGTREFFDRLTASTSDQSATDLNLVSNPQYQYRNKVWLASVPLSADGRLVDLKLIVEMEKDNKLNGSFVNSKNQETILNSVVLTYRKAH